MSRNFVVGFEMIFEGRGPEALPPLRLTRATLKRFAQVRFNFGKRAVRRLLVDRDYLAGHLGGRVSWRW